MSLIFAVIGTLGTDENKFAHDDFLDRDSSIFISICLDFIEDGGRKLSDCPAVPAILIYLVVLGTLDLILLIITSWEHSAVFLYKVLLVIAGYFWMNRVGDFNREDPQAQNYCDAYLLQSVILFYRFSQMHVSYLLIRYIVRLVCPFFFKMYNGKSKEIAPQNMSSCGKHKVKRRNRSPPPQKKTNITNAK